MCTAAKLLFVRNPMCVYYLHIHSLISVNTSSASLPDTDQLLKECQSLSELLPLIIYHTLFSHAYGYC